MRRRRLLHGPALVGFNEMFDSAHGDPKTPRIKGGSYLKVTPAKVGNVLLPFACPYCGAIKNEAVDPKKRKLYFDPERGFSWCPACRKRYVLDLRGRDLDKALSKGATYAPALVEGDGKPKLVKAPEQNGLQTLGA
jgi:hypothetical protein